MFPILAYKLIVTVWSEVEEQRGDEVEMLDDAEYSNDEEEDEEEEEEDEVE